MKVSRQLHEPLVVFFVVWWVPEQLCQAGHDRRDGALGEALRAFPVEGVLGQVGVALQHVGVRALLHAEADGVELGQLADDELRVSSVQARVLLKGEREALWRKKESWTNYGCS